jgi:hypothetical protein
MLWKMICVFILMVAPGCVALPTQHRGDKATHEQINHVVFMKLIKPAQVNKLIADCDRLLPSIPGVRDYWCGQHGDFERTMVDDNYDVGLCVTFHSAHDYAVYVEHGNHIELVRAWKPHLEWLRVHDVVIDVP